jgi:hypothetical protein
VMAERPAESKSGTPTQLVDKQPRKSKSKFMRFLGH